MSTATATTFHAFEEGEAAHRCVCGVGRSGRIHRHVSLPHAPASVTVQAVADLEHLAIGQRLLVEGELYEVAEVLR